MFVRKVRHLLLAVTAEDLWTVSCILVAARGAFRSLDGATEGVCWEESWCGQLTCIFLWGKPFLFCRSLRSSIWKGTYFWDVDVNGVWPMEVFEMEVLGFWLFVCFFDWFGMPLVGSLLGVGYGIGFHLIKTHHVVFNFDYLLSRHRFFLKTNPSVAPVSWLSQTVPLGRSGQGGCWGLTFHFLG